MKFHDLKTLSKRWLFLGIAVAISLPVIGLATAQAMSWQQFSDQFGLGNMPDPTQTAGKAYHYTHQEQFTQQTSSQTSTPSGNTSSESASTPQSPAPETADTSTGQSSFRSYTNDNGHISQTNKDWKFYPTSWHDVNGVWQPAGWHREQ